MRTGRAARGAAVLRGGVLCGLLCGLLGGLLAAGCGSSGKEPVFTPGGTGALAGKTAGQPAPDAGQGTPPTATAGPGRQTQVPITPGVEAVPAGEGLRVEIEWPSGLDADVAGAVRAYAESYTALWRAVTTGGHDASYLTKVDETAIGDIVTRLRGFLDRNLSARGVARLYALRVDSSVTVGDRMGVQVLGCVDESAIRMIDTEGKPIADQPSWTRPPTSVYLWSAAIGRDEHGVWRIRLFRIATYPAAPAKECAR
ncbi:hypothetical protein [Microtetraspora sp. NBRC 16547]|uniref:hypothetical protein n=1 Tax=Microtetraspora sp. NBRC 16547 TaxID=3030993 RepID=UPI0024A09A40|nr:hypothetical protein [Microtetraspora sp. NBRC 16547]GLW96125.1 hypothetical protein Misp02_02120 [Microtetraspora sp. NBRC 16547]